MMLAEIMPEFQDAAMAEGRQSAIRIHSSPAMIEQDLSPLVLGHQSAQRPGRFPFGPGLRACTRLLHKIFRCMLH